MQQHTLLVTKMGRPGPSASHVNQQFQLACQSVHGARPQTARRCATLYYVPALVQLICIFATRDLSTLLLAGVVFDLAALCVSAYCFMYVRACSFRILATLQSLRRSLSPLVAGRRHLDCWALWRQPTQPARPGQWRRRSPFALSVRVSAK